MDLATSIALGVGLSAATGFRVFVPFMLMSAAARMDALPLAAGFEWIGTLPALIAFATASLVEIAAYYVPWVDNLLDTVASPAALVAGTVASASVLGELSPMWQWILAIVAGGGAAGVVQAGTVTARATSSLSTGGLGNFAVATMENIMAGMTALLAVALPLAALLVIVVPVYFLLRRTRRRAQPATGSGSGR